LYDLSGASFYDMNDPNVPDYWLEISLDQKAECPRRIGKGPTQPIFFISAGT
jgi:hypothetical protein